MVRKKVPTLVGVKQEMSISKPSREIRRGARSGEVGLGCLYTSCAGEMHRYAQLTSNPMILNKTPKVFDVCA
jgi:hypothetical protein